jgi:N-acetylglutamate synthase-like GNAT family acetyltransferase
VLRPAGNEIWKITVKYRQALPDDLESIQKLLELYELPTSDCKEHIGNFIVAFNEQGVVGVGGYENCGNIGLLRSIAVAQTDLGKGIANRIFSLLREKAIESGIETFYLLTSTASMYFEKLGFTVCNRENVPKSIRLTKQFNELCPSSATVMVLNLCS